MHLCTIGYPGDIGGACTELAHTIRLWRRAGWRVSCLPTWKADPAWRRRLCTWGVETLEARAPELPVPEGAVAVSFCNTQFLAFAHRLLGRVPTVWAGCMTYSFESERKALKTRGPFDRYLFQSHYQRGRIAPLLEAAGAGPERMHVIRGAFCWDEVPYQPAPHDPLAPMTVGRLSRGDPKKFPANLWDIYRPIARRRARVMGVSGPVTRRIGPPPEWAEVLPAQAEPADDFLRSLDALVFPGGEAVENWPRVGLEALAAGVPVIADNTGGWPEMIRHGETGFLCNAPEEFSQYANRLAEDEPLRMQIGSAGRTALETELADPESLLASWGQLLAGLG